jgi:hypothetical protein
VTSGDALGACDGIMLGTSDSEGAEAYTSCSLACKSLRMILVALSAETPSTTPCEDIACGVPQHCMRR